MAPDFNNSIEVMSDKQGFFKKGERERIYAACKYKRDKVLIRLLWKTGRRISELLLLKVEHIDFENRNILWNILKKKKETMKWKPIDKETLQLLGEYIQAMGLSEGHHLFYIGVDANTPMSRQRAYQIVRSTCESAGVHFVGEKKPHPHHFRHSFVVDMSKKMKSPADIRKLQIYMEHSSMSVTEQYMQFSDHDFRNLIEENS